MTGRQDDRQRILDKYMIDAAAERGGKGGVKLSSPHFQAHFEDTYLTTTYQFHLLFVLIVLFFMEMSCILENVYE